MNLNEKLKNYLTHEENDFLKVENSYNKKTSYLVGFEFASGSFFSKGNHVWCDLMAPPCC